MRTIHKFDIGIGGTTRVIELPEDAKVLCISERFGGVFAWIELDDEARFGASFVFEVVGTGWELPEGKYIGTSFVGEFVWHVYLRKQAKP